MRHPLCHLACVRAQLVEPRSIALDVDGAPAGATQDGDGIAVVGVAEEQSGLPIVDGGELWSPGGCGLARCGVGDGAGACGGVGELGGDARGGAL